jgi:hypothetical protein
MLFLWGIAVKITFIEKLINKNSSIDCGYNDLSLLRFILPDWGGF